MGVVELQGIRIEGIIHFDQEEPGVYIILNMEDKRALFQCGNPFGPMRKFPEGHLRILILKDDELKELEREGKPQTEEQLTEVV